MEGDGGTQFPFVFDVDEVASSRMVKNETFLNKYFDEFMGGDNRYFRHTQYRA